MRRGARTLVSALLLAILSLSLDGSDSGVPSASAQTAAPFCTDGQAPRFVHGIAALRERLGGLMGDPVECEHVDPASGDTVQRTTTGLAYYRPSINMAIFTDGEAHWGRSGDDGRVILWRNASVTPPQPTDAEAGYLAATAPLRERAAALQRRLLGAYQQAERGQLDSLDATSLRALVNDLQATRDAYARLRERLDRLGRYHGLMVQSLNTGMGAAEMLTQARQLPAGASRTSFQGNATKYVQESDRLRQAAADAYVRALPVPVE